MKDKKQDFQEIGRNHILLDISKHLPQFIATFCYLDV